MQQSQLISLDEVLTSAVALVAFHLGATSRMREASSLRLQERMLKAFSSSMIVSSASRATMEMQKPFKAT